MPRVAHLLLTAGLVLCWPGLLCVCSLLICPGLLLFCRERFAPAAPQNREQTRRPA